MRRLGQGSSHAHIYSLVSTALSSVGGVRAVWGGVRGRWSGAVGGGGGPLLPSNETDVEDSLRHFNHLPHLKSNVKSLILTEQSKLVSI